MFVENKVMFVYLFEIAIPLEIMMQDACHYQFLDLDMLQFMRPHYIPNPPRGK